MSLFSTTRSRSPSPAGSQCSLGTTLRQRNSSRLSRPGRIRLFPRADQEPFRRRRPPVTVPEKAQKLVMAPMQPLVRRRQRVLLRLRKASSRDPGKQRKPDHRLTRLGNRPFPRRVRNLGSAGISERS